ncbi:hypothetical protein K1719_015932 [Acacia pycnantha]|nr:hypothetical protein K1719_015932 [Acacia pycnantha]
MQSIEGLKSMGTGSVVVEDSLGHEVASAAIESQSGPVLLDKTPIQVALRKLQSVESQKSLGSEHEDVESYVPNGMVLQKGIETRADGIVDGLILADRGIAPTMIGASHNVGLGREVNSCEVEEAIFEEIKDQLNIAQTGGRRVVEACGSPMKNGDRRKRGRPTGSGKAKAKVGISGAANVDMGRQLRFLTSKYNISLVVLVETKTSGDKCLRLQRKVGFDSSFVEEARGFSGGIWVLWKSQDIQDLL